ncbi:hypothetical protein ACMXYX_18175 (plasmid) [Neptuniibacter sp. QD72_48]|uniref:hypothetical protein n=1 Tax=Neptuniibacter sp. QD72_48 TaxID=3398214 RepID=UPI0039F44E2C
MKKGLLYSAILTASIASTTAHANSIVDSGLGSYQVSQGVQLQGMCMKPKEAVKFDTCAEQNIPEEITEAQAREAGLIYDNPLMAAFAECGINPSFLGLPDLNANFDFSLPKVNMCSMLNEAVGQAQQAVDQNINKLLDQELGGAIGNEHIGVSGGVQTQTNNRVSLIDKSKSVIDPSTITTTQGTSSASAFSNSAQSVKTTKAEGTKSDKYSQYGETLDQIEKRLNSYEALYK